MTPVWGGLDKQMPKKKQTKKPEFTDAEQEILFSIEGAYEEDPSPESGRQYCEGEDEYETAMGLLDKGFLRKVDSGTFKKGRKRLPWIHFGLTDSGFDAAGRL